MSNVQSVVTPTLVNGHVNQEAINAIIADTNDVIVAPAPKTIKASKATKLAPNASTAPKTETDTWTGPRAISAARNYGSNLAGMDGELTNALKHFHHDENMQAEMLKAMQVGYMTRRFDCDDIEANRIINLKDYNEKKQDNEHRTEAQQRVMGAVRVAWKRATDWAGIVKPKTAAQVNSEVKRAAAEAERKALTARKEELWEISHPKAGTEVDVNDAMRKLVRTVVDFHNSNAAKFKGDQGMAWRTWLSMMPKFDTEE